MKLWNGLEIPQLGYGTILQSGEALVDNVSFALRNGYDLIDTANRYGNEVEVGQGLRRSGLRRDEYFLETKLGPTLYSTESAIDDTLKRLDVDYIDIMILHHPVNDYIHAYGMLEKAYKAGKLRVIGLSNFPVEKIQEVLSKCEVAPMVMQVECHPYFPAEVVKPFCDEHEIRLQAWYPLGHGNSDLRQEEIVTKLAEKYKKTPTQIILRWHIQMGFGPVPGSRSHEHILENAQIFDFALTDAEMAEMATLARHEPIYKVTAESLRKMATTKCNFEAD